MTNKISDHAVKIAARDIRETLDEINKVVDKNIIHYYDIYLNLAKLEGVLIFLEKEVKNADE